MVILRKTLVLSLFVLLVALSFAALWLPVLTTLLRFHEWAGFPVWLFDALWGTTTLALSILLVAVAFLLIGLVMRRFWQQQ
jgi:hypothetical protein